MRRTIVFCLVALAMVLTTVQDANANEITPAYDTGTSTYSVVATVAEATLSNINPATLTVPDNVGSTGSFYTPANDPARCNATNSAAKIAAPAIGNVQQVLTAEPRVAAAVQSGIQDGRSAANSASTVGGVLNTTPNL